MMQEFENNLLGNLKGKIYGMVPVQAEGTVNGFMFYFRAKYDEWTFAISEHSEFDPVDIQFPETGAKYGYFAAGKYDGASRMEATAGLEIIQKCVTDYLNQKKNFNNT